MHYCLFHHSQCSVACFSCLHTLSKWIHVSLDVCPKEQVIECLQAVESCMTTNWIMLDPAKMEFLWLSTPGQTHRINHAVFTLRNFDIELVRDVRLLGVTLDETLVIWRARRQRHPFMPPPVAGD